MSFEKMYVVVYFITKEIDICCSQYLELTARSSAEVTNQDDALTIALDEPAGCKGLFFKVH